MLIKIARVVVWMLVIVVGVINVVVGIVEQESDTLTVGLCALLILGIADYFLVKLRNRTRSTTELKTEKSKLSRREARKQRHVQLESKTSWRFTKLAYFMVAGLWFLIATLIESYDNYDEAETGVLFVFGIVTLLAYPIFKRAAFYAYYGGSKAKYSQKTNIV